MPSSWIKNQRFDYVELALEAPFDNMNAVAKRLDDWIAHRLLRTVVEIHVNDARHEPHHVILLTYRINRG